MESDVLLTTGEAALLLGVSRQHVVDLIERGDLPATMTGAHRRVRRADLQSVREGSLRATRDQQRSRWLGIATAGQLVNDPERFMAEARERLDEAAHSRRRNSWDDEWRRLLDGPFSKVLDALTADTVRSRELRQNSPFVSVLSPSTRERVLAAFTEHDRSDLR